MKITRALISVSDKAGIAKFARALEKQGVDIISTGGTADLLRKEKIPVRDISSFTAFPEVLEGRVKTLHPRVHGGLLYKRGNPKHEAEARECGFEPIDLVVVNLYPFEKTIQKPDVKLAEAIENIDIGGPSMIRSAAKNYESVTVVIDPADYDSVLENMRENNAETTLKLREHLAIKAFIKTSDYDRAIGNYLNREQITEASFSLSLPLVTKLRYGENPHQQAALYGDFDHYFEKLHGKELSFNNILDISAATNLIAEFSQPTVAILKHTNPCGVGSDVDLGKAWEKAFATDKQAPFGGIIVCNRPITEPLAKTISEIFSEVIIAPEFEAKARALLGTTVPISEAVQQWANLGALVHALHTSDFELMARSLEDSIAEPRRAPLVPGLASIKKAALEAGALGSSLSGSGPSIFALCRDRATADRVASAMTAAVNAAIGGESQVYVSSISTRGAHVIG